MRRKLDPEQALAVGVERNAVVSAGAGSGKTTVLAERFARIVREGRAGVEEILTLTFTRKAAAEMHERIYALLLEDRDSPGMAEQIALFDRAQISTFDSFCAQIARGWSERFGVPPSFAIADEERGDEAESVALEFLLENWERPALTEFIRVNGFERVYRGLFASIARDYLSIANEKDFRQMGRSQLAELSSVLNAGVVELQGLLARIRALDGRAARAILEAHATIDRLPSFSALAAGGSLEELRSALSLARFSMRTGSSASGAVVEYKELADAALAEASTLLSVVDALAVKELFSGMFELLAEFQELVLKRKRRSGLLSFRDVAELAVRILIENRPLRRFYKERFRYILVDEFQDNNELQKRLLYLLSERVGAEGEGVPQAGELAPDKLFFVGDEKQSIYRFRGADVSVFKGLGEEITESGGTALSLGVNYRSRAEVIAFLNFLFPRVMAGAAAPFEARWQPLSPAGGRAADRSHPDAKAAPVRLFYQPYDPEGGGDEQAHSDDAEAWYIARFIHDSVANRRLTIQDGGQERAPTYDDFALLLRSTGNQIRYERLFRRFGIPYTTQNVRTLFLEAPLNDLYSLLELVIRPEERAAYAALLRSPLVNLSDETVARLLLAGKGAFAEGEDLPGAPPSDREKWARGRGLYEELRAKADLVPITELVRLIWYEYGYRYLLLRDRDNHGYLDYYDWFVRLAERADRQGAPLALFLDSIRPNLGTYERLPELSILQEQTAGVQLLTIHKAKGLEFPIVILANAGNSGRGSSEASEPYYLSDAHGLTLRFSKRGNYFYAMGKEENARKERAEAKRLLYVALTRARSHLVISGCHNRNNRSGEDALLNMVLSAFDLQAEALGDLAAGSPGRPAAMLAGDAEVPIEIIPDVEEQELYIRPAAPATEGDGRLPRAARRSIDLDEAREIARRYAAAATIEWRLPRTSWTATALNAFARERLRGAEQPELPFDGLRGVPGSQLPAIAVDPIIEAEHLEEPFGSLCHFALELALAPARSRGNGEEPLPAGAAAALSRSLLLAALPFRLRELLPERHRERLAEEAIALAARFLSSELGQSALAATARESESSFLYRCDAGGRPFFVSGKLDLLFVPPDPAPACVVDFKTDREVTEGAYDVQMEVYRRAAAELLGREVAGYLYYLRGGLAVEIEREPDLAALLLAGAEKTPPVPDA